MLYMLSKKKATQWLVEGMTTLQASHRNDPTTPPVANWQKIKPMVNLNGCHTITKWSYNYRGAPIAWCAFYRQCNWVFCQRKDYSASITSQWLYNTPCAQMPKNQNDGQFEWLLHNNHITIQLQRCSWCFICFHRAMQLSGWSKAGLLYKQHTVMAPQHPLLPNGQQSNRRATWMAVTQ